MLPIYYTSDEPGAPTLNNAAGSLISVLDAVLLNGWGLKSVTTISVAAGTATATCSGHGFVGGTGRQVLIAGASPEALNGAQTVTVVNANTFTFPTTAASGTATGTITAKRAPLGWAKPYSGTNVAMYARTDPEATGMLWRVEDTAALATYARCIGVETASSVDTYTAPFPTAAQYSGGLYISKGANSTAAKAWMIVGDHRTVYLFTDDSGYLAASQQNALHTAVFGDVDPFKPGDPYACLAGGGRGTNGTNSVHESMYPSSDTGMYLPRLSSTVGTSVRASHWHAFGQGIPAASNASGGSYPSPVDNGMAISRAVLVREDNSPFNLPHRGLARGMATPMAFLSTSGAVGALHGTVLNNLLGTTDSYLVVGVQGQGAPGALLFNISSAW